MASPWARLPHELIRAIVDIAAPASRDTTLALTRVSRALRSWAEPALYHTVVLPTPHALDLFRAAFRAKPPAFFAAHVRSLFVNSLDDAADIIRACRRLDRLAAYPPAIPADPAAADLADTPPLAYPAPCVVALLGALDDAVPWASPLFAHTRHLHLALEPPSPATACELSVLPALQRLAFPYDGDDPPDALLLAVATLLESTSLRVLLVLVHDRHGLPDRARTAPVWPRLARLPDTRLFVGTDNTDDWLAMVEHRASPWDGCEAHLKDWRCGLV